MAQIKLEPDASLSLSGVLGKQRQALSQLTSVVTGVLAALDLEISASAQIRERLSQLRQGSLRQEELLEGLRGGVRSAVDTFVACDKRLAQQEQSDVPDPAATAGRLSGQLTSLKTILPLSGYAAMLSLLPGGQSLQELLQAIPTLPAGGMGGAPAAAGAAAPGRLDLRQNADLVAACIRQYPDLPIASVADAIADTQAIATAMDRKDTAQLAQLGQSYLGGEIVRLSAAPEAPAEAPAEASADQGLTGDLADAIRKDREEDSYLETFGVFTKYTICSWWKAGAGTVGGILDVGSAVLDRDFDREGYSKWVNNISDDFLEYAKQDFKNTVEFYGGILEDVKDAGAAVIDKAGEVVDAVKDGAQAVGSAISKGASRLWDSVGRLF